MTANAKKLTNRANSRERVSVAIPTQPAATLRVFITALERLGHDRQVLMNAACVTDDQLEDPDERVPCTSTTAVIGEAIERQPTRHLGLKMAAETPIGAFKLLDYLIVTCETVGEGMQQFGRYLRLTEAPFSVEIREEEDPIRIVYVGIQDGLLAEFELALANIHLGREAGSDFRAAYVSLTHLPEDVDHIARTLGCPVRSQAAWLGLALSRDVWQLPLRRRDPVLHSVLRRNAEQMSSQLRQEDAVVAEIRRMLAMRLRQGEFDIRTTARSMAISIRSLQRYLQLRERPITRSWIRFDAKPPINIFPTERSQPVRSGTC